MTPKKPKAKWKNINMTNWDEMSDVKKTIGFFVLCAIVLFFVLSYLYSEERIIYIRKHGVWTILEVTGKGASWYGYGYKVYYKFQYNNQTYKDMVITSDKNAIPPSRFFMMIVPGEESKYFISGAVPEWFTLPPPQEGWKTRPSEREMRRMMEQDSIRRGLKEEVQKK